MSWPKGKPRKPQPLTPEQRADADLAARQAKLRECQEIAARKRAEREPRRQEMLRALAQRPEPGSFAAWEEAQRPVYPSEAEPPERDYQAEADMTQYILFGMQRRPAAYHGDPEVRYIRRISTHMGETQHFDRDGNPIPVQNNSTRQARQARGGDEDEQATRSGPRSSEATGTPGSEEAQAHEGSEVA